MGISTTTKLSSEGPDLNSVANFGVYVPIETTIAIEGIPDIGSTLTNSAGFVVVLNDQPDGSLFLDSMELAVDPGPVLLSVPGGGIELQTFGIRLARTEPSAPTVLSDDTLVSPPPSSFSVSDAHLVYVPPIAGVPSVIPIILSDWGEAGESLTVPIGPHAVTRNPDGTVTWHFANREITSCFLPGTGRWVDPPLASSFTYSMTNSALFMAITDFPPGFSSDFEVSVGGVSLGSFGPGDSVDFSGLPGGGATEFIVSGINPTVDTDNTNAFPLKIEFDSLNATFTMTSGLAATAVPSIDRFAFPLLGGLLILLAMMSLGARSLGHNWGRSDGG